MGDGGRMDRRTAFIALLLSLAAVVILLVGMTGAKFVVRDNDPADDTYFGLNKFCVGDACRSVDYEDIDNPAWIATLALWIVSLILILAGSIFVIFALFGVRTYKLFGIGNKTIYVGFIFQAIGLVVLPVGFKDFGRACSQAATGKYGCGQDPNCDADGEFDYFTLCSPYTFSTNFIISCVGVAVQMVSSIVYGCVDYEP